MTVYLSDDFDDNDISDWTIVDDGPGTIQAANQRVELSRVSAGGGALYAYKTLSGGPYTEAIYTVDFYVETLDFKVDNYGSIGWGLLRAGHDDLAQLGIQRIAGANMFRSVLKTDSAYAIVQHTDHVVQLQHWYQSRIYWKAATAVGANNGVFRVWLDGELIRDTNTADTDTLTAVYGSVGDHFLNAVAADQSIYLDDVAVFSPVTFARLSGFALSKPELAAVSLSTPEMTSACIEV